MDIFKFYSNKELHSFHKDYKKCGQCWKQHIQCEVANEYIENQKDNSENIEEFFEEVEERWRKTSLYKKVKELEDSGLSYLEIENHLKKQNIIG